MSAEPLITMPISEFKATCLAVLEQVRRTGVRVVVTRRGEPIAEVLPPSAETLGVSWIGSLQGEATITGDLVEPIVPESDWDVLRP
jgi:prevent-host-death family protein